MQNKISCIFMRGGTSKGPFFDLRDLPDNPQLRDEILLKIMGSPDVKQIDGIGGATFVTSKVVMAQPSKKEGVDVDYLFAQVILDKPVVDTKPACGNMMSGVGPFAIEKGWVKPTGTQTTVKVYNINSNSIADILVSTLNGQVNYTQGDLTIDGVPGKGAPVLMKMKSIEGGATGQLFPTGKLTDIIQGKEVSMIDAGNLMIHLKASDFDLSGEEQAQFFDENTHLMKQLESIRIEIAQLAGLGDVRNSVLPKIGLLSQSKSGGAIKSQYLTPRNLHPTHAVSGAVCIAAASKCEGTVASKIARVNNLPKEYIQIEHPSGKIPVEIEVNGSGKNFKIVYAGTYRTARKLMEGYAFYRV